MPNERKLDSKTVSNYFIGYSERLRGYKFYDPLLSQFFDTQNATFFEDVKFGGEIRLETLSLRRNQFRSILLLLTVYRLLYLALFEKQIWNLNMTILNNSHSSWGNCSWRTNSTTLRTDATKEIHKREEKCYSKWLHSIPLRIWRHRWLGRRL